MGYDRESGGTRPRAVPALDARDLTIRLLLAERAIAESAARIAELTGALAALGGITPSSAAGQVIVVDADAVSPFSLGFYHREFDKLGRPFRWTGKSDVFEIRLRLNRNVPWTFTMEVQANPNVDTKRLRGFVDYVEIPVATDDGGKILSGMIPERYFGTMATLTFLLPNTYVPSVVNPGAQDHRTLGLIFYELSARATDAMRDAQMDDHALSGTEAGSREHDAAAADALPIGRRRSARIAGGDAETTS
jgi:hypothetical protein